MCTEGYHLHAHVIIFALTKFFAMTKPLDGVRVAITENRFPEKLAQLLERQGAAVYSCPLLRETPMEHTGSAQRFMELCETTTVDFIVFYTGVGVEFLFRAVDKPAVIARSKIIARGPKAVNALRRAGITDAVAADSPTTEGILQTLSRENLQGKSVLVQLYGQDNPELRSGLETRGAKVIGISLYHYEEASSSDVVSQLVNKIAQGEVDAIIFTNGPQARFLLQSATAMNVHTDLLKRLAENVAVVSIGEITSRALYEIGIAPHVVPEEPKMGPMVKALADYFAKKCR
jgi:uroporphyrinogen-III synthase